MSVNIYTLWDGSWTATSIAGSSVSDTTQATTSSAIDNSNKSGTEVAVSITYGSSPTQGASVCILRDVNGTYETLTDSPFGFQMPYDTSATFHRTITVMADRVSKFKVMIDNETGSSITATVSYKQAIIQTT